jgi:hypothetical protein
MHNKREKSSAVTPRTTRSLSPKYERIFENQIS